MIRDLIEEQGWQPTIEEGKSNLDHMRKGEGDATVLVEAIVMAVKQKVFTLSSIGTSIEELSFLLEKAKARKELVMAMELIRARERHEEIFSELKSISGN